MSPTHSYVTQNGQMEVGEVADVRDGQEQWLLGSGQADGADTSTG